MTPIASIPLARRPPTPALWLCCGLLLGQWVAPWTGGWAFPAAATTAALAVGLRSPRRSAAHMAALAALAAAFGHHQLDARLRPRLPGSHVAHLDRDRAVLRGEIAERPSRRPSGLRFVLKVDGDQRRGRWGERIGRIQVTVRNAGRDWRVGDRLVAELRLRAPRNFGNPGEFDYEHHLARRQIYTTGFAYSDAKWRRLPRRAPPSWSDRVRATAEATLRQIAPPPLRAIAAALLLGDGASLPPEVRRRYARAGVSHVLAISGLHIGLVAAAAYAAARWLLARSERLLLVLNVPKLATAASLPPVVAYAAVAGSNAATLRATAMAALFLSALLFDRPRHWPATLAIAAAVVCSISPGAAFEASFQLSFAAVVAIVAGGNRLLETYDAWAERRLLRLSESRARTFGRWLVASQGMTLLALLATAPLTLHHFQQLSAVGVISNLFVVPIVGMGAVAFGLTAVWVTPFLPGAGGVLFGVCCRLLAAGDGLTALFAGFPGADLHLPAPSAAEIVTYYALLAAPWIRPRRLRRAVAGVAVLVAAVQVASWYVERVAGDELRVTFLSVGQGDSTIVEIPGGGVMLVDGGGLSATFDVGERVVAPFLLRRKILTVDTVVLTHPDFDHYGGLSYIVDRFGVKEVWTNGSRGSGSQYRRFLRACRAGAEEVLVQRGVRRRDGGVEIAVLHPPRAGADDSNDASVVVRLAYAGVSILLTGDLEHDGERALVRHEGDLHSTILKVPHHGSRTSSTAVLLEAVSPRLATVSVGRGNRYRMPHPEVVERYRDRSIPILRTDRDGAIEIRVAPNGAFQVTGGHRWRSAVTFPHSERQSRVLIPDFRLTGREMAT